MVIAVTVTSVREFQKNGLRSAGGIEWSPHEIEIAQVRVGMRPEWIYNSAFSAFSAFSA